MQLNGRNYPYTPRGLRRCQCHRCKLHRAARQINFNGCYYAICDKCGEMYDLMMAGFLHLDPRITLDGGVTIQEDIEVSMERGDLTIRESGLYPFWRP